MTQESSTQYSILDLVQATGIPRRTIRYYVQRELLDPPLGAGRGHYYVRDHLEQLQRIRELQDRGLTLEEIRVVLERGEEEGEDATPTPSPQIDVLTRIRVCEGIDIVVGGGIEPPSPGQIRALALAAADILGNTTTKSRRLDRRRGT